MVNKKLIQFMRICVLNDEIALSWRMSNIRISESEITFDVCGFNHQGPIKIVSSASGYAIYANDTYIRNASTPVEALIVLDKLIEENLDNYKALSDLLFKKAPLCQTESCSRWLEMLTKRGY